MYVESVIVDPAVRGRGWGKQIMLFVEDFARTKGAKKLWLNTKDKQDFYRNLGFKESGVVTPLRGILASETPSHVPKLGLPSSPTQTMGSAIVTGKAPPPPMGLPPTLSIPTSFITWMCKELINDNL
jgi:hypothetical protein